MQIIDTIEDVRRIVREIKRSGKTVGLVPTMGYLHEGHLQLVKEAKRSSDFVVVSIFVNPLQFGPNEDYDRYPRDLDHDTSLLREVGCDIVFAPSVVEMYPRPMATQIELPELSTKLCGKTRPTHFRGVATVVCKLLNIVGPDTAYFGQKDAQQVTIIRRMVDDLSIPVTIQSVPIVRNEDGLALSSRNIYLSETERPQATVLHRALEAAVQAIESGEKSGQRIAQAMRDVIHAEPGTRIDYAEVVDADNLEAMDIVSGNVLLAVAVYFGKTRLIDNVPLRIEGQTVHRL